MRRLFCAAGATALATMGGENGARADESGASFWLLGSYASQAAVPSPLGLSIDTTYYTAGASAGREVTFTRGGRVQAGLTTNSNYMMVTPSYAFETPVLGGQFGFGTTLLWGNYSSTVSASLVAPSGVGLSAARSDSMTAFGDVFPTATLKWAVGVHNFMTYATANVPLGAYDPNRQATVGLGRWAVDGGGGYTYYEHGTTSEHIGTDNRRPDLIAWPLGVAPRARIGRGTTNCGSGKGWISKPHLTFSVHCHFN